MILKKIKVKNFRNLSDEIVSFSHNVNFIIGKNGNGKTNLLESIYYLLRGKSFKKKNNFSHVLSAECVKNEIIYNATIDDYFLSGTFRNNENIFYKNNKKHKRINGEVFFISPSEAFQFFNVPAFRKDKFNYLISSVDKEYRTNLKKYETLINQKNSILKQKVKYDPILLEVINKDLAKYILYLSTKRSQFLKKISNIFKKTYKNIFSEDIKIDIDLNSSFSGLFFDEILKKLQQGLNDEIQSKVSLRGSHKDDYDILIDGFLVQEYASLGQMKMAYFSLIFSFLELFFNKNNERPLLLIDDVSGELDHIRLEKLIDYLAEVNIQVFLTSANEEILNLFKESFGAIRISNGQYINI